MADIGNVLLEVRNLRTEFVTERGVLTPINDVSFKVHAGEVLGLVGESGCGKSMTALSIMRLVPKAGRIVGGEIRFNGEDLASASESRMRSIRGNSIGMVFQDPMTSLNPVMTIGRQLTESILWHTSLGKKAALSRAMDLLNMVGIPDVRRRIETYPHQLSGGMRQRVMIAMALACEPELLIADEPTTALDVTIQAQILELLTRLREEVGMAMILITHDLGVVAGIADRINVMYAGHVVETSNIDDIYYSPNHPYTQGLLGSIPRLDMNTDEELLPIMGLPPNLLNLPEGCPFAPRCSVAVETCREIVPQLRALSPHHQVACHVNAGEAYPGSAARSRRA